jgi:hypothetical protein
VSSSNKVYLLHIYVSHEIYALETVQFALDVFIFHFELRIYTQIDLGVSTHTEVNPGELLFSAPLVDGLLNDVRASKC